MSPAAASVDTSPGESMPTSWIFCINLPCSSGVFDPTSKPTLAEMTGSVVVVMAGCDAIASVGDPAIRVL